MFNVTFNSQKNKNNNNSNTEGAKNEATLGQEPRPAPDLYIQFYCCLSSDTATADFLEEGTRKDVYFKEDDQRTSKVDVR